MVFLVSLKFAFFFLFPPSLLDELDDESEEDDEESFDEEACFGMMNVFFGLYPLSLRIPIRGYFRLVVWISARVIRLPRSPHFFPLPHLPPISVWFAPN